MRGFLVLIFDLNDLEANCECSMRATIVIPRVSVVTKIARCNSRLNYFRYFVILFLCATCASNRFRCS